MEHKQGPGAGLPAREPSPHRLAPSADETERDRLSEIQAAQQDNETAAALHAAALLGEQLLQANRQLELALAETARLHRALTERSLAAEAAEQRERALAERLVDDERALREAQCQDAAASRTIQALQSQLAALHASTSWRVSAPLRLAKTMIGKLRAS